MSYISRKQLESFGEPIGDSRDDVRGKYRKYYGGGKDGGDAPDYAEVAAASRYAADIAKELGDKQLAEAQRQYDLNRSVSAPVAAAQLGLMNQQQVQGDDYYNYMKSYSRPTEQALYYEAMGFTPDEIQQIETARSIETAAFKQQAQARQQATVPTTFDVPTFATEKDVPEGAISGAELGSIKLSDQTLDPRYAVRGLQAFVGNGTTLAKADPNKYYKKNADGTHSVVDVKDKIVEGKQTVTINAPTGGTSLYDNIETPETDALVSKLTAQAAERKKAEDAAARGVISNLNTDLTTRIGESDVDVYNRNQADIEAEAGMAVADSRKGFSNSVNTAIREGLRYGFSPEKLAASVNAQSTTQATQQAQAANSTRKAATQTMYQRGVGSANQALTGGLTDRNNKIQDESIATAKKLDVAGLYRGVTGASQGAYGLSLNAGNSAVQNNAQAGNALIAANQGAANTILQGAQQQLAGQTSILNSQTSMANNNNDSGIWGSLGQVGGAAIAKYSDKNVKKDIKPMDDDDANKALEGIKKTGISKWKYDDEKIEGEDDKTHIGAMAQDLKKNLGKEVSNGKMVDLISAIGVNMAATKALAKQVDELKGKKK